MNLLNNISLEAVKKHIKELHQKSKKDYIKAKIAQAEKDYKNDNVLTKEEYLKEAKLKAKAEYEIQINKVFANGMDIIKSTSLNNTGSNINLYKNMINDIYGKKL